MRKGQFKYSVKIGQKFNRLSIIADLGINKKDRKRYVLCLCNCGKNRNVDIYSLYDGNTQSCGCLGIERRSVGTIKACKKHGESHGGKRTPEYATWIKMKERCYWKKSNRYYRYGARGIIVCDRWLNSFENFLKDMGRKPSKVYSIDRINNDGNYDPSNCRWATAVQQANNKSK